MNKLILLSIFAFTMISCSNLRNLTDKKMIFSVPKELYEQLIIEDSEITFPQDAHFTPRKFFSSVAVSGKTKILRGIKKLSAFSNNNINQLTNPPKEVKSSLVSFFEEAEFDLNENEWKNLEMIYTNEEGKETTVYSISVYYHDGKYDAFVINFPINISFRKQILYLKEINSLGIKNSLIELPKEIPESELTLILRFIKNLAFKLDKSIEIVPIN